MKKLWSILVLAFVTLTASAQYQVANSGFEDWERVAYNSYEGEEPVQWNSFLSATGSYTGTVARVQLTKAEAARPGSEGHFSAKLFARKVLGSIYAQGNMTSGCINAGSMSASDGSGNYNYTNEENEGQCMPFSGRPDAMRVWVNAHTTAGNGMANISVYLHEKGYYQDPNTANVNRLVPLVAHGAATPASVGGDSYSEDAWREVIIPFEYFSANRPYYALISFSTNSVPGAGTESDYMYVDDIEMLYYSELASAVYNGTSIKFSDGKAVVDAPYNEKMLKLSATGVNATIRTAMNEETYVLTVTVRGDNISQDPTNLHTYEIQFAGISGAADDEADAVVTPETTVDNVTISEGSFYLKNVATGMFLGNENELTDYPHVWNVAGAYTFTDNEGKTITLNRKSSNSSFNTNNFDVLSNGSSATTFTTRKNEDNSYYFYLPNFQYYDGVWIFGGAKSADIYYAASQTSGLFCTDEANEYGKWALVDINQYERVYGFWKNYAKASLQNGIEVDGFFTPGRTQSVSGLPLGIYEFGQSTKFYLPAGENIVITADQSRQKLTYYGRLNFSLNAEYDGVKIVDNQIDDFYDAEKPLTLTLGNGAENYMTNFDAETGKLTVIISGYGRSKEHEVQFAVPEMSLSAQWRGEDVENGASIDEEFNAEFLTLASGRGTDYETAYDEETGLLTVTVTSIYGQTEEFSFQFAVYPEVLATLVYDDVEAIKQYCNSAAYTASDMATVAVEMTADGKANFLLNGFKTLNKQGEVVDYDTLLVRGVEVASNGEMTYTGQVRTTSREYLSIVINALHDASAKDLRAAVTVYADSVLTDYFYNIQAERVDTFIGDIRVFVNGKSAGMERTSIIVEHLNNSNINFSLADFALEGVGPVGSINLLNKEFDAETGKFGFEGDLFIAPGTTGEPSEWMGPTLGAIPVTVDGEIKSGMLTVFINIDFREQLGQIVSVTFVTDPATVGIRAIGAEVEGEPLIYDLSGRRVSRAAKGIYIINGRKVVR